MKKIISHLLILTILLGVFSPIFVNAQTVNPVLTSNQTNSDECGWVSNWDTCFVNALTDIFATILYLFLAIISYVLYIAGTLLDYVLRYTIIDLKVNLAQLTGINITWKVVKDLMNIAFIFILVYKGIELIIGVGSRESIKKFISTLILAALLVNFSLFFTRVLIDASNIATIGFYKAILQSSVQAIPINGPTGTQITQLTGISVPFMQNLGLASFWAKGTFTSVRTTAGGNWNMIILPLMGMFLFLITAFVFVAISIIFIIRYITLIILLILSPIAYMGAALPGFGKASKDWWDTLTGQLIFGPIYMIMTWIVLKLMSTSNFIVSTSAFGELVSGGTGQLANVPYQQTSISLIFNFAILIGLIIASLLVSKDAASRGSKFVGKAVGNASGMASTAVFGGTAWVGRKTMGNAGRLVADNAALQERADKGGTFSRLALYGARKARGATYDARNATIPTSVIGDAIEGTVGRTGVGKAMGLNDMQIGNIPVMAGVSEAMGAGKGGTKSVIDERKESKERVTKRESANANELAIAQAKVKINKGAVDGASDTEIEEMEQALAKLTEKQTVEIVESNKELLKSQNFANKISVQTLEAIEKSDKFSDEEKGRLKESRFKDIRNVDLVNDTKYIDLKDKVARGVAISTDEQDYIKEIDTKVEKANKKIKGLADSEIEMLSPTDLAKERIVGQFKSSQFDGIGKSKKFLASQKQKIKEIRFKPLLDSLDSTRPTFIPNQADRDKIVNQMISKDLSAKDLAGLASEKVKIIDANTGLPKEVSLLEHPEVIKRLKGDQIKKMVVEMNPDNISKLGDAIEKEIATYENLKSRGIIQPGHDKKFEKLIKWYQKPDNETFL